MLNGENENIFLRCKPCEIMINIMIADGDAYASKVAKDIDCTYSHVVKVLQKMEEMDLIKVKKNGRLKWIIATEKGKTIANCFLRVREITRTKYCHLGNKDV